MVAGQRSLTGNDRLGEVAGLDDRAADVRFEGESRAFGFENEEYAKYFLGEDEYVRFSSFDSEDEVEYGVSIKALVPPAWNDEPGTFEYIGTY